MPNDLNILALVGSLRQGSYNKLVYRAVEELAPAGLNLTLADIADVPLYNDDERQQHGWPPAVHRLRQQIAEADAVLFIAPEYNYSVPGVLKNAIDWVSRPPDQPFQGKPVAIMGASGGMLGTARMQYHLRQILVFLDALPLNKPEVMIAHAPQKFDAAGQLTDETTRRLIRAQLEALQAWTLRLRQPLAQAMF